METMLDAREVAAILKVSRRKFETMVKEGTGPVFMWLGGLRRWRPRDIEEWSNKQIVKRESADQ